MIIEPLVSRDPAATMDPRSVVFETTWLPVAGPTAVTLARLTPVLWATACPFEVADVDLAKMLGLPSADRARKAAHRIALMGLGRWDQDVQVLGVWTSFRQPTERQLRRAAGIEAVAVAS